MAIVYVGTTYTASVGAHSVKQVKCEQCGCRYAYFMWRQATGSGHSVYMLDNKGASNRAESRARQALDKALDSCDPVECPDCGWFNREMVEAVQRTSWRWTPWGEGKGVDPNAGYPQEREHFPGMPSPIRLKSGKRPPKDRGTGNLLPPVVEPGGWISVEPERDKFPSLCCACLDRKPEMAQMQFTNMRVPPLIYPICRRCAFKYNWIERLALFGMLGLGILICTWIFCGVFANTAEGRRDATMPILMGGGLGLVLGLIAGALAWLPIKRFMPYPVKLSRFDHARNIYRIRFANPGFTEALQKAVAAKPLPRLTREDLEPSGA